MKEDGRIRPGEIVWTWVEFDQNPREGKDRPVLVVDYDGARLLGLMIVTKTGSRNYDREARAGRRWMDIGDWSARGRASEVRLDQVIRLDGTQLRRNGDQLDRITFLQVRNAYLDLL